MRNSSRVVIAAALLAAVVMPASSVSGSCHTSDTCTPLYTPLRVSIVTLVPSVQQISMLAKTFASERLIPVDPCKALLPLSALDHQVEGLAAGHVITEETSVTLRANIQLLMVALQPGDPC